MKHYTTLDLELADELLRDQDAIDKYGRRLFSWNDLQWALLVQMWFDRMRVAAVRLQRRFNFSYSICLRWAMRSAAEGTYNQLVYG